MNVTHESTVAKQKQNLFAMAELDTISA